ncbi:MAG: SWIM zinc finger family protein, partial [Actinomycetota bacterium]|nr:SWIM zinc finger family protein [Actinomycetota bacterium]
MIAGYSYLGGSTITKGASCEAIDLATSGGAERHPFFFSGFLARPGVSAPMLLSVAKVAATRFYTPTAVRDALIRAADPVVTADGVRLRFESFSACNGVYARADLFGESLVDGGFVAGGTTNVDFGSAMRDALASIGDGDAAHLAVGADEVSVATLRRSVVEKRVRLPQRWLRGFAEVQVVQVAMLPRFELDGAQTKRFLSMVARARRRGQWWATATTEGLALSEA